MIRGDLTMTATGQVFRFQFVLSLLFSFLLAIQPVAAFGADIAMNSSAEAAFRQ
jgi:hypothetical protein